MKKKSNLGLRCSLFKFNNLRINPCSFLGRPTLWQCSSDSIFGRTTILQLRSSSFCDYAAGDGRTRSKAIMCTLESAQSRFSMCNRFSKEEKSINPWRANFTKKMAPLAWSLQMFSIIIQSIVTGLTTVLAPFTIRSNYGLPKLEEVTRVADSQQTDSSTLLIYYSRRCKLWKKTT